MVRMDHKGPSTYYDMITLRWSYLQPFDKYISVISGVFITYMVATSRLGKLGPATLGIILITASYAVLVTIVPISVNPLIPIQPPKVKYLTPILPFFVFISVLALSYGISILNKHCRRWIIISANSIAITFLLYAAVYESPFKYHLKSSLWTTHHPQKSALFWRYHKLHQGFQNGHGICAQRTAPLVVTQHFIDRYVNRENVARNLVISHSGNMRVLHYDAFKPNSLTTFSFIDDPFTFKSKSECLKKYARSN